MVILRWDPFRDLIAIQDRMNRLFETALSGTGFEGEDSGLGSWSPVTDVIESDTELIIFCELPGMERENIDIRLADNVLTISGDRRIDRDSEDELFHRVERSYGPFRKALTLPVTVDAQQIGAQYQAGVLTISLPKHADVEPRKITVRVS